MIPTASSLYPRNQNGVPFNYGAQPYFTGGSFQRMLWMTKFKLT
jgi:hypothetical protein